MPISEVLWPEDRVAHIGRHGVRPEEFEEVCFGASLVLRAKATGQNPVYYLLGETDAGRPPLLRPDRVSWRQGIPCDRARYDHQGEAALRRVEETMTPKMPKTDSIEELATFWQHHDLTDFEDELEEVSGQLFQRAHVVGVPLTGDEHKAVSEAAASRGIDEAELIREWVKERLRHG